MVTIDNKNKVRVSVVVPAYNEQKNIAATIADILNQDFAEPIELLVVDNNCTDNTALISSKLGARVVPEKEKGTRFAYHRGFADATGDIIVMINADVRVDSNWLSTIVNEYKDKTVVGVGTHVKFTNCPWYVNLVWFGLYNLGTFLNYYGFNKGVRTFWGASMSSTKEAFNKVGGFNHGTNTNEDMVYTNLISQYGKVVYTHKTVARLDGRRYSGGPLSAARNWYNGIGRNALFIGAGGESKVKDFEDIR